MQMGMHTEGQYIVIVYHKNARLSSRCEEFYTSEMSSLPDFSTEEREKSKNFPNFFTGLRRVATECFGGIEYNREKPVPKAGDEATCNARRRSIHTRKRISKPSHL
jgi:hypothetical protein